MRHPRAEAFEQRIKEVFDRIDGELEATYGTRFALHPARPAHRETGNPELDGLFNVGAAFSAGFGSRHGSGYVVEIRMATLDQVPPMIREEIERTVVRRLRDGLREAFPGRHLAVKRDGHVFKITGNLFLGSA